MENEKNVILKIENLTKKFGGLVAVNEVNIHLNEGEILGVIGANGAGKTTVFNMVSGSFHPTSGKIIFNGKEIQNMQAHEICKQGIGRTYQVVKPFGALTLRENVMVGAMMRHPNVKEAGEIADKIIELLGISHLADVSGRSLTLVQMKRMEIARALATEPKVLLLDEVMAGLNPSERTEIIESIRTVSKTGVSIIIIEHVIKVIMALTDRVYCMNQGKLISEGTPQEVMADPKVIESYLGVNKYAT
ncbi:MAG: ABC transporter ATP-binding protein [Ruminococcaceae bacterium]|nr:ABC transporter ATP-binding protein [Oscillospiraceae bacterium]